MLILGAIGASILRLLIVFRGARCGMIVRYAWFYSYIVVGFLTELAFGAVLIEAPSHYAEVYWPGQFLTLAVGCGLVLEIFRHVLSEYSGAERFARYVCLLTFAAIFLVVLIYPRSTQLGLQAASIEMERDVRSAQIVFFVAILAVIFYYSLPLGRNMLGMIYGYGIYLFASLVTLTFRAYIGHGFTAIWRVAQPLSFDLSLSIWLVALWGYYPNPAPAERIGLDSDYENLVAVTRGKLDALRRYVRRGARLQ